MSMLVGSSATCTLQLTISKYPLQTKTESDISLSKTKLLHLLPRHPGPKNGSVRSGDKPRRNWRGLRPVDSDDDDDDQEVTSRSGPGPTRPSSWTCKKITW